MTTLNVHQVSALADRSEDEIRILARTYEIPAWKDGIAWKFDSDQVSIWIDNNPKQTWMLVLDREDFEGKTYSQLATELGVTQSAIEYHAKKLGIRRR